jgi:antitoxin (DNA-binding transcriptional repressor) of toxin-antitoxin stability system
VLKEVARGKGFVVTLRGRPVARIAPEVAGDGTRALTPEQEEAWRRTLARRWRLGSRDEPFDRGRLHERRP